MAILNEKFTVPDDFDAAEYFRDSYGIVVSGEAKLERVVIRAYGREPFYLRDLPLHHSQQGICATEEYTDFELRLKVTSDFIGKLMSRGEWVEVLEPRYLADEIVEWHKKAVE